jgi:hypothetical protein
MDMSFIGVIKSSGISMLVTGIQFVVAVVNGVVAKPTRWPVVSYTE